MRRPPLGPFCLLVVYLLVFSSLVVTGSKIPSITPVIDIAVEQLKSIPKQFDVLSSKAEKELDALIGSASTLKDTISSTVEPLLAQKYGWFSYTYFIP